MLIHVDADADFDDVDDFFISSTFFSMPKAAGAPKPEPEDDGNMT